jgi:hypothetical protein
MKADGMKIDLRDALRVRSAEFWLKLGQPAPALLELEQLSRGAQSHPWASEVRNRAECMARGLPADAPVPSL